jgi:hypothetical protein
LEDTLLDPSLKNLSGYLFYLSGIPFWISRFSTLAHHAFGGEQQITEFYIRSEKANREVAQ